MKLFHKIFLCFVVIFGISFQTAGVLLIDYAYENAVEREKKYALQQFQYNKYICNKNVILIFHTMDTIIIYYMYDVGLESRNIMKGVYLIV